MFILIHLFNLDLNVCMVLLVLISACKVNVVIGTSMSETISWKNTLASESLVQPDTISAVLPGVVCVA